MKLYKLTDQNWETRNHTKWGPGVSHTTNGEGDLCGPGWLHAYLSPELAVLLNPIHASLKSPVLWLAEGVVGKNDNDLKVGTTELTTIEIMPLLRGTTEQRVRFAILCATSVYNAPEFYEWAKNRRLGKDSLAHTACAARVAAYAAAYVVHTGKKLDLVAIAKQALEG